MPEAPFFVGRAIQPEYDFGDKPGEECGVLAIHLTEAGEQALYRQGFGMRDLLIRGLKAQVHRGKQNTGLSVSTSNTSVAIARGKGGPQEAFKDHTLLHIPERGRHGQGHNRYTTSGGPAGAQPVFFETRLGDLVMAHNGAFHNNETMQDYGSPRALDQPSDSWVYGSLVADEIDRGYTASAAMIRTAKIAEGAYSLVTFNNGETIGMRDPRAMRPLVLGRFGTYGWMLASETPTLQAVGATFEREVRPGEMVLVNDEGSLVSHQYAQPTPRKCAMEGIYLSQPEHLDTYERRYRSGQILAKEAPVERADIVVPILGSGRVAAKAYADTLGVPYVEAVRKVSDERAFMAQGNRGVVVRGKLVYDLEVLRNQIAVFVDDSIVRGDTLDGVSEVVHGVTKESHYRSASPPIKGRCYYGVAISTRGELISNSMSKDTYQRLLNGKSLEYLSLRGLYEAYGEDLCTGCFDGNYQTEVPVNIPVELMTKTPLYVM